MVEKTHQRLGLILKQKLKRLVSSVMLLSAFLAFSPQTAQAITLISDEETEQLLYNIALPFYKNANIPLKPNSIYIVQDNTLNAFVADGNNLFIHTGTIVSASNSNELAGVIAHEIGHIAGGHILRGKLQAEELQQVGLASLILASAAAVTSGRGDAAMAIALGGQSTMLHGFTSFRTDHERSADEAAVKYLQETNQSPRGMLNFMKKIQTSNRLNGIEESPYFRTHPVTRERISFLEQATRESKAPAPSSNDEAFKRVRAKLIGFLNEPEDTYRQFPSSDTSIAARYARAIADFKALNLPKAIKGISSLIDNEPDNPYFRELKAQMYMETGKTQAAEQEYAKALQLRPKSALFQISWSQAAMENNPNSAKLQTIINRLNQAVIHYPDPLAWLLLSRAYDAKGERAYSDYAAAEYSLGIGAVKIAQQQILRAQKAPNLSPQLKLKIDDLHKRISTILKKDN